MEMLQILALAKPTTEKASFNSKKSISSMERLACFKAFGIAKDGAIVKSIGSSGGFTPTRNFSQRLQVQFLQFLLETKITAAPPSFNEDAFGAVTVPFSFLEDSSSRNPQFARFVEVLNFFVVSDNHIWLASLTWDGNRCDFVIELTGILCVRSLGV